MRPNEFKLLMSNDVVEIEYNNAVDAYCVSWKKNINSHRYRFTYLKAMVLLNKYRPSNFILNVKAQRIFGSVHQRWFEVHILDKWKHLKITSAYIVVELNSARKKYYSDTIVERARDMGLPIKVVTTYEKAIDMCKENKFDFVGT